MSRAEILMQLVRDGELTYTQARIDYGSANLQERLGHRFPRLFKRWAADNARRDRESREMHEWMQGWPQRMRTSMESALDEQRRLELADALGVPRD